MGDIGESEDQGRAGGKKEPGGLERVEGLRRSRRPGSQRWNQDDETPVEPE